MAVQDGKMSLTENGRLLNMGFARKPIQKIPKVAAGLMQLILTIFWAARGLSTIFITHQVDFLAFIGAGHRFLSFQSPYGFYPTVFGASIFQSVPWLAWLFSPLALLNIDQAWLIFVALNACLLLIIIILIGISESVKLSPINFTYVYACVLAISYFCLAFGQVTILQVAVLSIMIVALKRGNQIIAGVLMPLVLIKPHLIIWFLFSIFTSGKRQFIVSSILSTILISAVSFALQPSWPIEMVKTFVAGQTISTMENWKFSTLAGILSLPPIYGFLVLPMSIPFLIWLRRRTSRFPFGSQLTIGLAFSLAISPYAFTYDLPLLIPALIWLSQGWTWRMAFVWTLIAAFSVMSGFTGVSFVVTLITCTLIVIKVIVSTGTPQSIPSSENGNRVAI
jgi:hypothetical protein